MACHTYGFLFFNVMALDFSIQFRGTKNAIETFKPVLLSFIRYYDAMGRVVDNRDAYRLLMGNDIDPETKQVIKDDYLREIMNYLYLEYTDFDLDIETKNGYDLVEFNASSSGFNTAVWEFVCDKYELDFEMRWTNEEDQFDVGEFAYINKELNSTEISDVDLYDENGDYLNCYDELMFDKNGNAIDCFYTYMRELLVKQRGNQYATFDFSPVVILINCENNYLDNLKSFVDSNKHIPELDKHLVKSGLFKTTVGTEKRRRIEVEVNGVKLYADSKHGVKQRKLNVEKLRRLLA